MTKQFPLTRRWAVSIMATMKRSPLSRVENLIRRVVEEPFTWLAGDGLDPFRLATHLARYFDDATTSTAPNHFTIYVNPGDYDEMATIPLSDLEVQVADYVALLAERRGHRLSEAVHVSFMPDVAELPRRARTVASHEAEAHASNTDVYLPSASDAVTDAIHAIDAFLIVQGRQHIPLDRPVTRIGRRMDNDIVLDAPSISRQHAQIRWRQRYFAIYDVSRHGQTAVNGSLIREHILRPGDVISLSDVLLVYGEGRDAPLGDLIAVSDEELDTTQLKPFE